MPEMFETFNDAGQPTGLAPRNEVHRTGLWHRAVLLFLYDRNAHVLLHRRALDKDLYADLWDHSIGEHLLPQESFVNGARRGLREEYGIDCEALTELGSERRQCHKDPNGRWHDREMQMAFRAQWDPQQHGALAPDPIEVAAIEAVHPTQLQAWLDTHHGRLTPWFESDLTHYNLLP